MKKEFDRSAQTGRDREAAAYFSSGAFLEEARDSLKRYLVAEGRDRAYCNPKVVPQPQDMSFIKKAFEMLKTEYPELNHVRLNKGAAATAGVCLSGGWGAAYYGGIVFDTKENTAGRRLKVGWGP
ncbi:MAG: hypothetical protein OXT65_12330 [Alphaproteobacteria bacterium]|nr:hypothetical protein [Alphaproteobacteria bacterium]